MLSPLPRQAAFRQIADDARDGLILIDPDLVASPVVDHDILQNPYGRYCVPHCYAHREVPRILSTGQVYEPRTLDLIRITAAQGDVISGGAFIGDFFPAISPALAHGAVLHSFEPNPLSFAAACHTVALNALRNVAMSPVAVGAGHDTLPLRITGANDTALGGGSQIVKTPQAGHTIDVPVLPLDDLVPEGRHVSVLHLDIEGQELPALLGASRIVHQSRPLIILEARRVRTQTLCKRFMRNRFRDLGYRVIDCFERNLIFASGQD